MRPILHRPTATPRWPWIGDTTRSLSDATATSRPPDSRPTSRNSVRLWAGSNRLVPLLLAAGCSVLAGCAIVDEYSSRATVYNLQSEQAHDQGILLNIVRASLRRPRQFTIVQKITGTATAEGSANVMFPFGPHLATSTATNSTMFSAGLS